MAEQPRKIAKEIQSLLNKLSKENAKVKAFLKDKHMENILNKAHIRINVNFRSRVGKFYFCHLCFMHDLTMSFSVLVLLTCVKNKI